VYAYDYPRKITDVDRMLVRKAFAAILEELDDNGNTSEMFPPYARVIGFVLANRRIQRELID
jgi:hypothetical protein